MQVILYCLIASQQKKPTYIRRDYRATIVMQKLQYRHKNIVNQNASLNTLTNLKSLYTCEANLKHTKNPWSKEKNAFMLQYVYIPIVICNRQIGPFRGLGIMVFNAIFNKISVISWRSVLLVEETEYPGHAGNIILSYRVTTNIHIFEETIVRLS
jgi:hypothetical protein